jgi:multiple sugar transport system permease protein
VVGAAQAIEGRAALRATWWRRRRTRRAITFYAFISPWLIGFVLLGAVPLVLALAMSFTNYDGLNLDYVRFVGLDNYARAISDPDARHALQRTLVFVGSTVVLGLVVQLGAALLLDAPIRGRGVFRTLFYLPYVVPVVAGAWIWKIFTDPSGGLLNALVRVIGPDFAMNWIVEEPTTVLVLFTVWAFTGAGMVIFLAGLQGIPSELKEAAQIDGAGPLSVLRFITLPLLTPVILFQLVVSLIGALQIIQQPLLLAPGILGPGTLPPRDNYLYIVHAYHQIFVDQRFGYGAALLWILFLVTLALTLLLVRSSRHWVHYEEAQ